MEYYVLTAFWCVVMSLLYSILANRSDKGSVAVAAPFLLTSLVPYLLVTLIYWSPSLEGITIVVIAGIAHTFLMALALATPTLIEERRTKRDN